MGLSEYASLDGLALAALVREGKVSPRELVDEAIARIERVNPSINAVVRVMADEARLGIAGPVPAGPFAGVPFLLKDFVATYGGVPLTCGSRAFRNFVPKLDSELVRRHKAAGLIVVGKTNLPELGLQPICEPALTGPTHTPWKLGQTSGGSSGGSAAAVAAGIVPMAHGGDGGGSLRIPASCCGVFGFKPSRGRMPTGPYASEQWWGYAVEHAITRSVRDSAALLDATSGAEAGDVHQLPRPARPFLGEVTTAPGQLRVLLIKQPFMSGELHPDCAKAVENTAKRLSDLGHVVEEGALDVDALAFGRDFFLFVCVAMADEIASGRTILGRPIRVSEMETSTWLAGVLGRQASAPALFSARSRLAAIARRASVLLERYEVILTPTLAKPPLAIGALDPSAVERALHKVIARLRLGFLLKLPGVVEATVKKTYAFMPYTALANVAGLPSMSLPLDWNEAGLPIGSMITGRLGDEATLFRLAGQLEAAYPWSHRRPPAHSDEVG
jgi:amidase